MKPTPLLLAVAALAGTAAVLTAGPGPQYWNRPSVPAKHFTPAAVTVTTPPTPAPATVATAPAPAPTAVVGTAGATCACCQKAP